MDEETIVNVSSLMRKVSNPTLSAYLATKFALLGFTRALRWVLLGNNIKVAALLPTLTKTDIVDDFVRFKWVPEGVAMPLMRGLQQGSADILVG